MHTCDTCGEEFESLSRMRLDHDPCPVAEEQCRQQEAVDCLREERGLEVGDACRVVATGEEVEVVDVAPGEGEDADPVVTWVPVDRADTPENREQGPASELV